MQCREALAPWETWGQPQITTPSLVPPGARAPEDDVLQVEGVLDDAGGGYAHTQHILLGGQVA